MRNLFYLIAAVIVLNSCGGDDGPGGSGSGTPTSLKACFTQEINGGIVIFNPECSEGATSYTWNFGDGESSNEENPQHEYQLPGDYTVTLTVGRNLSTATDVSSVTITIDAYCIACDCQPGASEPSSEFCGTKQKADSACVACDIIAECACDSVNLDPGIYVFGSATSTTPTYDYGLQQAFQDVFGNTPPYVERPGYFEGMMYLKSGEVQILNVGIDQDIVSGGSLSSEPLPGGTGVIYAGTLEENGTPFNVVNPGLHWVGVDLSSATWYIIPVEYMEIIGSANLGWSAGSRINVISEDENQVVLEATNLDIYNGEFKFRLNSDWILDREFATPSVPGFQIPTNLGVLNFGNDQTDALHVAGYNIFFSGNQGKHTVRMVHTKGFGINLQPEFIRTGDPNPFDPANFNWGIIGSATVNGWDSDTDFLYRGEQNGTHLWVGMIFLMDGEFKYRINDEWNFELNAGTVTHTGNAASQISGSNNFVIDVPFIDEGFYYIKITTSDNGNTWNVNIDNGEWGIVGAATPGGWDNSTPLVYGGAGFWSLTLPLTADEFKFRVNDEWEINLGGSLGNLVQDGPNLSVPVGGLYTVILETTDFGLTYSAILF